MTISYEDFEKVDIRVGRIVEVSAFPEAKRPAFKLKIDFGPTIGEKMSSVQAVGAHTKDELEGKLVCCVVNFEPKQIGPFVSEVLTLGFKNTVGDGTEGSPNDLEGTTKGRGWVLITPMKETVEVGDKLS